MNIMLACALGMSTSLLVTKMLAAAKAQGKDYHIWAVDIESVEYEEGYDVVLLGPQVSNRIAEVRDSVDNDRIPVALSTGRITANATEPLCWPLPSSSVKKMRNERGKLS